MSISFYKEVQAYYGVGKMQARLICAELGISEVTRGETIDNLKVRRIIERCKRKEVRIKQQMRDGIRSLTRMGSYRGHRHRRKLPVNGQRTRSNAKTIKRWKV